MYSNVFSWSFFFALENTGFFFIITLFVWTCTGFITILNELINTLKSRKMIDSLQQDSKYLMEFITYAKAKISDFNSTKGGKGKVGEHCYKAAILYMR